MSGNKADTSKKEKLVFRPEDCCYNYDNDDHEKKSYFRLKLFAVVMALLITMGVVY